jgi:hypothetical protein
MEALRFATVRLGVVALEVGGQVIESDVRILRESDGRYRVLAGELSEPLPSLDEAVLRVEEGELVPSDVSRVVRWRSDLAPLAPGEASCPICGAPVLSSPRYPRRLCPACVLEATDAGGRPLRFANTDASGGLEARYADDDTRYTGETTFVRGVSCRAAEAHFGGIVVQPIGA